MGDLPSVVEFEWPFDSHSGGLLAIINSALAIWLRHQERAALRSTGVSLHRRRLCGSDAQLRALRARGPARDHYPSLPACDQRAGSLVLRGLLPTLLGAGRTRAL